MRPRRKRKLTNYGEGYLHWIEENQLQRALMKSLREKPSKNRTSTEESSQNSDDSPTSSKMPRLSVAVGTNMKYYDDEKDEINDAEIKKSRKIFKSNNKIFPNKKDKNTEGNSMLKKRILRSERRRHDSESSSHATMMHSCNSDNAASSNFPKDTSLSTNARKNKNKKVEFENETTLSKSDVSTLSPTKTRAQRKFASNASPPDGAVRRSVRCEGRLKKSDLDKIVASSTVSDNIKSNIPDKRLPETKDFLNYLCFRNTPIKVKFNP